MAAGLNAVVIVVVLAASTVTEFLVLAEFARRTFRQRRSGTSQEFLAEVGYRANMASLHVRIHSLSGVVLLLRPTRHPRRDIPQQPPLPVATARNLCADL